MGKEFLTDRAMHDVNLWPMLRRNPALDLRAAKIADGNHELRIDHFSSKAEADRRIELIRPVNGQAVRRAAQTPGQAGHRGGIGSKVNVDVLNFILLENLH